MVSTKHQKPVLTVEPLGNSVNRRAKNLPACAFRAPDPEEKISESKTAESHKPETSLVTILVKDVHESIYRVLRDLRRKLVVTDTLLYEKCDVKKERSLS